tara:strand:- start:1342 stop:1761 length:420 start_codon:yes stop_codon:yes gene_type:complete
MLPLRVEVFGGMCQLPIGIIEPCAVIEEMPCHREGLDMVSGEFKTAGFDSQLACVGQQGFTASPRISNLGLEIFKSLDRVTRESDKWWELCQFSLDLTQLLPEWSRLGDEAQTTQFASQPVQCVFCSRHTTLRGMPAVH